MPSTRTRKQSKATEPQVRHIKDHAPYRIAAAKLDEMRSARGELLQQIREAEQRQQSQPEDFANIDIGELLAGTANTLDKQLQDLRHKLDRLDRAIRQQQVMHDRAYRNAVSLANKARREEHLQHVKAIAAALHNLQAALIAEEQWRRDFAHQAGCPWSGLQATFQPLRGPQRGVGAQAIQGWYRQLAENGIDVKEPQS